MKIRPKGRIFDCRYDPVWPVINTGHTGYGSGGNVLWKSSTVSTGSAMVWPLIEFFSSLRAT